MTRGTVSTNQLPTVVPAPQSFSPKGSRIIAQSMSTSNFIKASNEIMANLTKLGKTESKRNKFSFKNNTTGVLRNDSLMSDEQASEVSIPTHRHLMSESNACGSMSQTVANDAIIEEIVEDSAPNTKRQSIDEGVIAKEKTTKVESSQLNLTGEQKKQQAVKKPIAQE